MMTKDKNRAASLNEMIEFKKNDSSGIVEMVLDKMLNTKKQLQNYLPHHHHHQFLSKIRLGRDWDLSKTILYKSRGLDNMVWERSQPLPSRILDKKWWWWEGGHFEPNLRYPRPIKIWI